MEPTMEITGLTYSTPPDLVEWDPIEQPPQVDIVALDTDPFTLLQDERVRAGASADSVAPVQAGMAGNPFGIPTKDGMVRYPSFIGEHPPQWETKRWVLGDSQHLQVASFKVQWGWLVVAGFDERLMGVWTQAPYYAIAVEREEVGDSTAVQAALLKLRKDWDTWNSLSGLAEWRTALVRGNGESSVAHTFAVEYSNPSCYIKWMDSWVRIGVATIAGSIRRHGKTYQTYATLLRLPRHHTLPLIQPELVELYHRLTPPAQWQAPPIYTSNHLILADGNEAEHGPETYITTRLEFLRRKWIDHMDRSTYKFVPPLR
jgi:hypothetical protein